MVDQDRTHQDYVKTCPDYFQSNYKVAIDDDTTDEIIDLICQFITVAGNGDTPPKTHYAVILQLQELGHILDESIALLSADGTFFVCSQLFEQLFNLMAEYQGVMIPVMHVLMTSRHAGLYEAVFKQLKEDYPTLNPEYFMSDFEAAITLGVKAAFPSIKVKGCNMHYSTAVYRQFGKYNLLPWVKRDTQVGVTLRLLMCLTFLPPSKIGEQIKFIRKSTDGIKAELAKAMMLEFIDNYIIGFWYKKIGPSRMGLFGLSTKTNNHLESLHSTMKRTMLIKRPRFYRFLVLIHEKVMKPAAMKLLQVNAGQDVGYAPNARAQRMIE